MASLNGDLGARVSIASAQLDWTASPSGTVWRKRLHRVGPAEAGQVTSLVRYEPGASFPAHDHPDGEEILVLEGVFSDEHGDWPRGSYLLNPEGFRHAPFSRDGCLIFVKLRQYPGRQRQHLTLQTETLNWETSKHPGLQSKSLYQQSGFADHSRLEQWRADTAGITRSYAKGAEILVLDGELADASGRYGPGHWLRLPAGYKHSLHSQNGCRLYIKEGGFAYLQSVND